MNLFGRNKNKGKPPPNEPPSELVRQAFADLRIHVRLMDQGVGADIDYAKQLHEVVPELAPFGSNQYAAVRAVLDWDHQIPSEYALLRIYVAYSKHEARLLDTQIRAREQAIAMDNVYPEFDLPDFGELDSSETYIGVLRPGGLEFEEFRFFSDWKSVRGGEGEGGGGVGGGRGGQQRWGGGGGRNWGVEVEVWERRWG